jgi:hypothetical protein
MPESMDIHFADATWESLSAWLNQELPGSYPGQNWSQPADDGYLFLVYEFRDPQREFEPDEFDLLCRRLGGRPTKSLLIELSRRNGETAVAAARSVISKLQANFRSVAFDDHGNLISDSS